MSELFKTNFVIVAAPLDPTFSGGPQELFDAIIENMEIQAPTGTNFFVVGSSMPTSNIGPWLKDGTKWYVFDTAQGTYVPLDIDDSVTQVFVTQAATPDAPTDNDPSIWLRTVGTRVIAWYFWDGTIWRPGGNTPPSGPTDSRPTNPVELEQFFDTDIACLIHWERGAWRTVSGTPGDLKFVSTAVLADAITQNPGWIYAAENLQAGRGRVIGLATKDPGASPAVSYNTDVGVSSRAQEDVAGEETHVLTSTEIESHSHVVGTSTALNSDNNIQLQRVDDGEGPSAATPLVVPSTKAPNYFEVKGDGTTNGTKNGTMPDPGLGCMLVTSRQFKLADAANYTSAAAAHNILQPTIWLWALQKT